MKAYQFKMMLGIVICCIGCLLIPDKSIGVISACIINGIFIVSFGCIEYLKIKDD